MTVLLNRIAPGQHGLYRTVRLAALKESPSAFETSYREARAREDTRWRDQAEALAQASDRAAFLALRRGAPVGLVAFYGSARDAGEIMQVWVAPRSRGTGVAAGLLERALLWARVQGYRDITVRARAGNLRALRFYEKAGFRRVSDNDGEIRLNRILT